jgi:hypothetical protein
MAVSFTDYKNGDRFIIGGQSSLAGANGGHAGTMPTYDITREAITLPDGSHVSFRYDITVVGVATNGVQDVTSNPDMIPEMKKASETISPPNSRQYGNGKLEIAPYGGGGSIISFGDARLVSVEMSEQDEETAGTQYQNYTYTFEAYKNTSNGGSSSPTWMLKSASETWSLAETGEFTYKNSNYNTKSGNKYKVFELTHTVSAQGIRKYSGQSIDAEGHAWRQAVTWVRDRLNVSEALGNISQDLMDTSESETSFNPKLMNAPGDTKLIDLFTDGYLIRNRKRVLQSDIAEGTYSVTDTYLLTQGVPNATVTIDANIESSADSEQSIRVTVNGTITGMSTQGFNAKTNTDKYNNALTEYGKMFQGSGGGAATEITDTRAGLIAKDLYDLLGNDAPGHRTGAIYKKAPISFDETHNKVDGTIDWSVVFVDTSEAGNDNAITKKVKVSFTNYQGSEKKPNPIPVVQNGPYLYTPGTTDEKTATFDVEMKMIKSARGGKPDGEAIITPAPLTRLESMWKKHEPRITSRTENWNPNTGVYTLQLVYTFV